VAIVTASHNPGRYNGIKFMVGGRPAVPELMAELRAGLDAGSDARAVGSVELCAVGPAYEQFVVQQSLAMWDAAAISRDRSGERRPIRAALDTMGGACTLVAPRVLDSAGYAATCVSPDIDPHFSHRAPNPANDANLGPLTRSLRAEQADVGIALDGDGDRVVFLDETARIVRPEQIAAVLVRHGVPRPTVVYDLKCASLVPRAVQAAGGTAIMRPSGHGFIKTTMIERRAELGVEVSGHHFFAALGGGDDGLFTALVLLELMARTGRTLGELVAPFPWPAITPDLRLPYADDGAAIIDQIAATCGGQISRLDGVRAEYAQGWALARVSITEPVVTFRFESGDLAGVRAIAGCFLAGTPQLRTRVLEMIR
jgi:phosphomannomutase/phosphoglucomutase